MASGRKTPPGKVRRAARILAETGSMSEAARQTGVPESTLRGVIPPSDLAKAREVHARATEQGIHEGATVLALANAKLGGMIATERLEPADLAAVTNATARAATALLAIARRDDERRQAALTRRKLRAEIAAIAAGSDDRHAVRLVLPDYLFQRAEGAPDADDAVRAEREAGDLPPRPA